MYGYSSLFSQFLWKVFEQVLLAEFKLACGERYLLDVRLESVRIRLDSWDCVARLAATVIGLPRLRSSTPSASNSCRPWKPSSD